MNLLFNKSSEQKNSAYTLRRNSSDPDCLLRLPRTDEAGVLEVEVLKHAVHPALLARSNLARPHVPSKQACALEEVDNVVVVGVDKGEAGHLVPWQTGVDVGVVRPDLGEGYLVLELSVIWPPRIDE